MGYRAGGGALGVLAAVALVIVFASALSWAWTALGLVLRTPTAVTNLGFVLLFPLTFLSNVFVAPATMPDWLRHVADANPISHLVTAARALMDGTAAGHDVFMVLATLAVPRPGARAGHRGAVPAPPVSALGQRARPSPGAHECPPASVEP